MLPERRPGAPACYIERDPWACGAVGSALPWHGRGRGFESLQVHQTFQRFADTRFAITHPFPRPTISLDTDYDADNQDVQQETFGFQTCLKNRRARSTFPGNRSRPQESPLISAQQERRSGASSRRRSRTHTPPAQSQGGDALRAARVHPGAWRRRAQHPEGGLPDGREPVREQSDGRTCHREPSVAQRHPAERTREARSQVEVRENGPCPVGLWARAAAGASRGFSRPGTRRGSRSTSCAGGNGATAGPLCMHDLIS